MKRPTRNDDGVYLIKGKKYPELFGSRTQVFRGNAYKTTGGLTVNDLIMNKHGRIVSAAKHKTAKKEKRLQKAGFFTKKGQFGYVKRDGKTMKNRKTRGGNSGGKKNKKKRVTTIKGGDQLTDGTKIVLTRTDSKGNNISIHCEVLNKVENEENDIFYRVNIINVVPKDSTEGERMEGKMYIWVWREDKTYIMRCDTTEKQIVKENADLHFFSYKGAMGHKYNLAKEKTQDTSVNDEIDEIDLT